MFEQVVRDEPRNVWGDWILRGGIALAFVLFGVDKFPANGPWVSFFDQVGFGQWFRYVTGVVEIAGGVLLLIPWTVSAGLLLLACTMASAALIHVVIIRQPANAIIPVAFCIGLAAFWLARRTGS